VLLSTFFGFDAKDSVPLERSSGVIVGVEGASSARVVSREEFLGCYFATVAAVHGYLLRASCGDRPLAEDLTQEVYSAALVRARDGDAGVLALPWLRATARNKLVDHFRRVERERRKIALLVADAPSPPPEPDAVLLDRLQSLPPTQRAAVALRYVDDLPVDDVARALGKSRKATESLLSRARETLRREVPEDRDV
jgi:RNA polymerase sigma-70 factor (ECF subfamily)